MRYALFAAAWSLTLRPQAPSAANSSTPQHPVTPNPRMRHRLAAQTVPPTGPLTGTDRDRPCPERRRPDPAHSSAEDDSGAGRRPARLASSARRRCRHPRRRGRSTDLHGAFLALRLSGRRARPGQLCPSPADRPRRRHSANRGPRIARRRPHCHRPYRRRSLAARRRNPAHQPLSGSSRSALQRRPGPRPRAALPPPTP